MLAVVIKYIVFYERIIAIIMRVKTVDFIFRKTVASPGHTRSAEGVGSEVVMRKRAIFHPPGGNFDAESIVRNSPRCAVHSSVFLQQCRWCLTFTDIYLNTIPK